MLLLQAATYWLLDTLRRWSVAKGVARMTLDTPRAQLTRIGGWVKQWPDRARRRLAPRHPNEGRWRREASPAFVNHDACGSSQSFWHAVPLLQLGLLTQWVPLGHPLLAVQIEQAPLPPQK